MSANVETMFSVRETPWHGLGPVSYTHLDVYKRQADAEPASLPTAAESGCFCVLRRVHYVVFHFL